MNFAEAAEKVKKLKGTPSADEFLDVYALFKQASVGDVNTSRPGMVDLQGKAKWDSWESKKGISKEDAQKQYIQLVETLVAKYGA